MPDDVIKSLRRLDVQEAAEVICREHKMISSRPREDCAILGAHITLPWAAGLCHEDKNMTCDNQVAFCRVQMRPCDHVGHESDCPYHTATCQQMRGNVPTIKVVKALYVKMHEAQATSHNRAVITEVNRFCRLLGIPETASIETINYDSVERYVGMLNVRNVTKIGAIWRMQCLVGRHERVAYRKAGLDVHPVDLPVLQDDSRAYRSATDERAIAILAWYRGLMFDKDGRRRIYAMMMLKYAMRNGDVLRLRWSNFHVVGSRWQLEYVPHKTERATAGRSVKIWLNPSDQVELMAWRASAADGEFVIPRKARRAGLNALTRQLNASIRAIGILGSKGLYELRKMCVDTVYHMHGAEAASAYSGDDFKTVKFHYADTSSMNLKGISDAAFGS